MQIETIISLVVLGVIILAGIAAIIISLVRGELKKFIIAKMEEADELYKDLPKPEKSQKKLLYVLEAVKEKYKLAELFINIKKFIEQIIDISKKINAK